VDARIKNFGLEFVHMAKFAWAFMGPEERRFDFDCLEQNVKAAAERGLKVVLCTRSATPNWTEARTPR
jgi:beta-galactosidase